VALNTISLNLPVLPLVFQYSSNIVESGIKHHKPKPTCITFVFQYSSNIVESGIKHHKPKPTCITFGFSI
jgi:hypothetical protein